MERILKLQEEREGLIDELKTRCLQLDADRLDMVRESLELRSRRGKRE